MESKKAVKSTIWLYFAIMFLGLWLIAAPLTFGYDTHFLGKNDVVCGLILLFAGWQSRHQASWIAPWIVCGIGLWLQIAPLVFWGPTPSPYINETVTGIFVIIFSIIVPGLPRHKERKGREIPQGWSYNPSSWPQRLPVIALACLGWFAARYLEAYQMGFITTMWDPWFHDGTIKVITSPISKAFPFPDAGMGALAYSLEALLGCKGGTARWRTMPWLVLGFGILVVPLSLISIVLIILQPMAVGAWCGLCLMIAFCMLLMVMLTLDEVTASLQCLRRGRRMGLSWSEVLWEGLPEEKNVLDTRSPSLAAPLPHLIRAAFWGCSIRWNLVLAALIGAFVMLAPALFHMHNALADIDHIFGALGIVVAMIAMADVTRGARWGLILLGAILVCGGLLNLSPIQIALTHIIMGIVWIGLALPKPR